MRNPGRRFDPIETQAAAWLVRRDGGMNALEEAEFLRWRRADPRHAAAVSEIEAAWSVLDRPADCGQTDVVRAELGALARRDRRRWLARGAGATLFAAAAGLAVIFWPQPLARHDSAHAVATASTARVSSPERQTLPDGSVVELNHGARIAISFEPQVRRVIMKNGEAHFSVVKNPQRPFIVEAGSLEIRAVGTAFAVQLGRTEVEVIVTEGTVSVAPPNGRVVSPAGIGTSASRDELSPSLVDVGQRTIVPLRSEASAPVVVAVPVAEMKELLSWRVPRLDFSETSIVEASALFNRHNDVQLRIGDDAVAAMRVTGVFRADNIDGFVQALESSLGIRSERRGREIVLRSAR